jgi:hypothetical protein
LTWDEIAQIAQNCGMTCDRRTCCHNKVWKVYWDPQRGIYEKEEDTPLKFLRCEFGMQRGGVLEASEETLRGLTKLSQPQG